MNSVAELLPGWAWVIILIALSFPFFMFSLGFVIKIAIDKALAGKLKEINNAVIELQHIRDDLKILEKLNKLDSIRCLEEFLVTKFKITFVIYPLDVNHKLCNKLARTLCFSTQTGRLVQ